MKYKIFIFLFIIGLFSCKKDPKICDSYTELTDKNNLIDISPLNNVHQFLDTLKKYPNLQVYRVEADQYGYGMFCHCFYKGLKDFSYDYTLFKNVIGFYTPDTLSYSLGAIYDSINFSLTPSIDYKTAIGIAKKNMQFKNTCISYRLGIYNLNAGQSFVYTKNYKLVWWVQGESGYPYVYLDANTGQVYGSFDGMEI